MVRSLRRKLKPERVEMALARQSNQPCWEIRREVARTLRTLRTLRKGPTPA